MAHLFQAQRERYTSQCMKYPTLPRPFVEAAQELMERHRAIPVTQEEHVRMVNTEIRQQYRVMLNAVFNALDFTTSAVDWDKIEEGGAQVAAHLFASVVVHDNKSVGDTAFVHIFALYNGMMFMAFDEQARQGFRILGRGVGELTRGFANKLSDFLMTYLVPMRDDSVATMKIDVVRWTASSDTMERHTFPNLGAGPQGLPTTSGAVWADPPYYPGEARERHVRRCKLLMESMWTRTLTSRVKKQSSMDDDENRKVDPLASLIVRSIADARAHAHDCSSWSPYAARVDITLKAPKTSLPGMDEIGYTPVGFTFHMLLTFDNRFLAVFPRMANTVAVAGEQTEALIDEFLSDIKTTTPVKVLSVHVIVPRGHDPATDLASFTDTTVYCDKEEMPYGTSMSAIYQNLVPIN